MHETRSQSFQIVKSATYPPLHISTSLQSSTTSFHLFATNVRTKKKCFRKIYKLHRNVQLAYIATYLYSSLLSTSKQTTLKRARQVSNLSHSNKSFCRKKISATISKDTIGNIHVTHHTGNKNTHNTKTRRV